MGTLNECAQRAHRTAKRCVHIGSDLWVVEWPPFAFAGNPERTYTPLAEFFWECEPDRRAMIEFGDYDTLVAKMLNHELPGGDNCIDTAEEAKLLSA